MKQIQRILTTVLFLAIIAGCSRSTPCEKEIYLMPEGFRGQMIVYFDQPDGQAIQYEDEARLYLLPPTGLLKTQFPRNGGCMGDNRIQFYYEDEMGDREKIDFWMDVPLDSIPANTDYVLMTFLSEKGTKPDFTIHLIGTKQEFKSLTKSIRDIDPVKILEAL